MQRKQDIRRESRLIDPGVEITRLARACQEGERSTMPVTGRNPGAKKQLGGDSPQLVSELWTELDGHISLPPSI